MKANVGSIVKIVNEGHVYPSYKSFFVEQGFPDLVKRHCSYPGEYNTGRVVFCGKHQRQNDFLYAIELGAEGGGITIVGERGIELVDGGDDWFLPEIDASEVSLSDFLGV